MKITIGYAYPSSITATALGSGVSGCFYACKIKDNGREDASSMQGFARWDDAKDWADATDLPFCSYSMPKPLAD